MGSCLYRRALASTDVNVPGARKLGASGGTLEECRAASYGRFVSWCLVPVAEHDFSCCGSWFGGEREPEKAKLDPVGECA